MVTPSVITMLMTSSAATQGRGWGGGEGVRGGRGEGRGESRAPNGSSEALLRWGAAIPRYAHQET